MSCGSLESCKEGASRVCSVIMTQAIVTKSMEGTH